MEQEFTNPDMVRRMEAAVVAGDMCIEEILGLKTFFNEPQPHLAARYLSYFLEGSVSSLILGAAQERTPEQLDEYQRYIDESVNPDLKQASDAISASLEGNYSKAREWFAGEAESYEGSASEWTEEDRRQNTRAGLAFKKLAEELPDTYEPFKRPGWSWGEQIIIEELRKRKQGGEANK